MRIVVASRKYRRIRMGDIESAIADLVRETIEKDMDVPSEDDVERMVESEVEQYMERHLDELLEAEKIVQVKDMDILRNELLREIEVRTIRHQAGAFRDRMRDALVRIFTRRVRNGRRVQLWTLLF